jgi:hypothetical protein
MGNILKYLIPTLIFLISISCENNKKLIEAFNEKVKIDQEKYAPDLSLNVFEAKLLFEDQKWIVRGETTVKGEKERILSFVDSLLGEESYADEFIELPHSSLGDSSFGIITVSAAHLREKAGHAAQLIDQNIMGKTIRLLKNKGGWYLIQTEYGYIGWMRRESFVRTDQDGMKIWEGKEKVKVTGLYPLVYSQPNDFSEPVTDVVLNALLAVEKGGKNWIQVSTPDARTGFIQSRYVTPHTDERLPNAYLSKSIIQTARSMMGIPYLWGGNSSKGNDCSGFTQTVFAANQIRLLRDARQQAREGEEIIPDEIFSNILPGDLLFFGAKERITHVGISLGGAEFIHQSGIVHINSLDSSAHNFSLYRKKTLKVIKRMF